MKLPESLAATKQPQKCHGKGEGEHGRKKVRCWWKEGEGRGSQLHKKPIYTILYLSASINELNKIPPLQLPKLQDSLNKSWLKFPNLKYTTERPPRTISGHF